jgi:pimeloyl-ACP methyl ester carboxylesterase
LGLIFWREPMKRLFLKFLAVAMVASLVSACGGSDDDASPATPRPLSFGTTLPDGTPLTITGTYFEAAERQTRRIQVLLHGAGYDQEYWNGPLIAGQDYSYAKYMVARGWDVLALNLPGVSDSARVNGNLLSVEAQASAIQEVVRHVRSGELLGTRFGSVALVGHSFGGFLAAFTQGTHASADALVLTGSRLSAVDAPAPEFAPPVVSEDGFILPVVGVPEARVIGYHLPSADPGMIAYDAQNMGARFPLRGLLDLIEIPPSGDSATRSINIRVPVLVQLGQNDRLAPAEMPDIEAARYPNAARVTVQVLPAMGHMFNLHLNRHDGWKQLDDWLTQAL